MTWLVAETGFFWLGAAPGCSAGLLRIALFPIGCTVPARRKRRFGKQAALGSNSGAPHPAKSAIPTCSWRFRSTVFSRNRSGPAVPSASRFSRLAVFQARLDVRVGQLDQPAERHGVGGSSRPQLHMAHELSAAVQQAGWVRQRRALKEADIHVRTEDIYITEGDIAQACNGTAVMQHFSHLVPALAHHLKPGVRMAPKAPPCSCIHASMAGSRSTAPSNRSNSVLILAGLAGSIHLCDSNCAN